MSVALSQNKLRLPVIISIQKIVMTPLRSRSAGLEQNLSFFFLLFFLLSPFFSFFSPSFFLISLLQAFHVFLRNIHNYLRFFVRRLSKNGVYSKKNKLSEYFAKQYLNNLNLKIWQKKKLDSSRWLRWPTEIRHRILVNHPNYITVWSLSISCIPRHLLIFLVKDLIKNTALPIHH